MPWFPYTYGVKRSDPISGKLSSIYHVNWISLLPSLRLQILIFTRPSSGVFQIIIKRRSYIPPTFIEFMHGVKPRDGRWIRPQGTQVAKRSITSPLSFWRIKAMHMGQGWWTQHRWTWWNSGRGDGVQDSPALSASLPWGHRVGRDWATEQQSASPGTPLLLTPPGHRKTIPSQGTLAFFIP